MKTGIELIAEERQRQIEKESWTKEHDAEHQIGVLAKAAVCYALPPLTRADVSPDVGKPPFWWPFSKECWKPERNRVRELVKAGALIAAEIDRIQQEQPEVDMNKHAITYAFLKCERCGKIVSEMYGEKFNNIPRNRDKYLAFLKQVELDDRFGELAGILQRYGAMPKPKEQPEVDLEKVCDAYCKVCGHYSHTTPTHICRQACDYFKKFEAELNRKEE